MVLITGLASLLQRHEVRGRPGIEELFMMQQTGKTEALQKILNDFLIAFEDPDSSNYNVPLWRSRCDKNGCEDELLEQPTFNQT